MRFHSLVPFTYGLLLFTGAMTDGYNEQIQSIIQSLAFHVNVFVACISYIISTVVPAALKNIIYFT